MPWPATHILIAEKFFDQHFSHLDRQAFMIGTCFPDIRYPANINRELTHFKHIPLSQIKSQSAFTAGLYFHTMVDSMWNAHVKDHRDGLFSEVPHHLPMIHTMKILQDKVLYPKLNDWQRIAAYFESTLPEEATFGASPEMVQRWHSMLAFYLSKPPTIDDLNMLTISLPPEMIKQIRACYLAFQENHTLTSIMAGFYDRADDLLVQS